MKRFQWVLIVVLALVAGIAGGVIGNTVSKPEPVHAQPKNIRIALVDLIKVTRQSQAYADSKIKFEQLVTARKERMKLAVDEYERLAKELEDMKRKQMEPFKIQHQELMVKAKQEEAKVIENFCRGWLEQLSDDFQKEVLQKVYTKIADHCKLQGYDMVLQLYDLEAGSGTKDEDQLAATRAWAETLKQMPVLYAQTVMPKGEPNQYIKDVTEECINLVKGG